MTALAPLIPRRSGAPSGQTPRPAPPRWITEVVDGLAANGEDGYAAVEAKVKAEVETLCQQFPFYPNL